MTTTTITINVELGAPSSVLDVQGAVDRPVHIAVAHGRGVQFYTGQVTMAPDRANNGVLAPTGYSLDCWISSEILGVIQGLEGADRRRYLDALESIGTAVIEIAAEAEAQS